MNNSLNNFNARTSANKIIALVEKISATCDALVSALDITSDAVGNYGGVTLSKVEAQPEFVDVVILNVAKIKNHLRDIKKALRTSFIKDYADLRNIVSGLLETSDSLSALLHSNGFFHNNFEFLMMEIQASIDQILEEVEVFQYQAA